MTKTVVQSWSSWLTLLCSIRRHCSVNQVTNTREENSRWMSIWFFNDSDAPDFMKTGEEKDSECTRTVSRRHFTSRLSSSSKSIVPKEVDFLQWTLTITLSWRLINQVVSSLCHLLNKLVRTLFMTNFTIRSKDPVMTSQMVPLWQKPVWLSNFLLHTRL